MSTSEYVLSTTAKTEYFEQVNEIVANYQGGYEGSITIDHGQSDNRVYVTASGVPMLVDGLMQEIDNLGKTEAEQG